MRGPERSRASEPAPPDRMAAAQKTAKPSPPGQPGGRSPGRTHVYRVNECSKYSSPFIDRAGTRVMRAAWPHCQIVYAAHSRAVAPIASEAAPRDANDKLYVTCRKTSMASG